LEKGGRARAKLGGSGEGRKASKRRQLLCFPALRGRRGESTDKKGRKEEYNQPMDGRRREGEKSLTSGTYLLRAVGPEIEKRVLV